MDNAKKREEKRELKKKIEGTNRSFKTEILMLIAFMALGAIFAFAGLTNWVSLSILLVGLVSLYFNDVNKWLDLGVAVIWSGLYAYFSIVNGFIIQAILISGFYLFINIADVIVERDMSTIVVENNKLKTYQIASICIVSVFLVVGSYFFSKMWKGEILPIFDAITAVVMVVSLYMMLKRCSEYFVVRLIAMILTICLWVARAFFFGYGAGGLSVAIMYIAFIVYDNIRIKKWSTSAKEIAPEKDIFESAEYKAAEAKYRKEQRRGLPSKSVGVDKEGQRS